MMMMIYGCSPSPLLSDSLFRVHPSVSQALAENRPVVALESTIITHGMPYPHNLRFPEWPLSVNKLWYQHLIFVLISDNEPH